MSNVIITLTNTGLSHELGLGSRITWSCFNFHRMQCLQSSRMKMEHQEFQEFRSDSVANATAKPSATACGNQSIIFIDIKKNPVNQPKQTTATVEKDK